MAEYNKTNFLYKSSIVKIFTLPVATLVLLIDFRSLIKFEGLLSLKLNKKKWLKFEQVFCVTENHARFRVRNEIYSKN